MKNIALGVGAVVVIGLIFVGLRSRSSVSQTAAVVAPDKQAAVTPVPKLPVIHVSAKGVVSLVGATASSTVLKSGDTLAVPSTIRTDKSASASIYFPDGSEARLKSDTTLTLDASTYNAQTGSLVVEMNLTSGRLWSKIIELATPDSRWEVETANAVATVRGTAFDVHVVGSTSSIYTANNKIALSVRDPKTKEMLAENVAFIEQGKMVAIGDAEVRRAQTKEKLSLQVRAVPAGYVKESWVASNARVDEDIDRRVGELKETGATGATLRERLRERTEQQLQTPLQLEILQRESAPTVQPAPKSTETTTKPAIATPAPAKQATPVALKVTTVRTMSDRVLDGSTVAFKAMLTLSDGTSTDVTKGARWQVVGPIGKFLSPGQFLAELDPSISETGEGSGSVIAVWTDPAGREEFLGKSSIFKVVVGDGDGAAI